MGNRRLHLFGALLLAVALILSVPGSATAVADKDCSDFNTQKAAQEFFIDQGGPEKDPHNLDADGDGIACESLPCPCSTSQGGGGGGNGDGGGGKKVIRQVGKVIQVVDGDTVKVKLRSGPRRTVRLLGIDTPEVYGGKECWGPQASKKAKKWLPKGKRVRLISDPTQDYKDRYGRLLRYVSRKGDDINRRLVRFGHAKVYVYGGKRFQRAGSYFRAQRWAKRNDRGLWGAC